MTTTSGLLHRPTGFNTEELLSSARGGDQEAWRSLFERYRRWLAFKVRVDMPDFADRRFEEWDVLQTAFLAAYQLLDTFEYTGSNSFRNWLAKIVVHRFGNEIASTLRERERRDSTSPDGVPHTSGGGTPSELLERKEIVELVSRLTPDEQALISMRFVEDLTFEEIGEELGIHRTKANKLCQAVLSKLMRLADPDPE